MNVYGNLVSNLYSSFYLLLLFLFWECLNCVNEILLFLSIHLNCAFLHRKKFQLNLEKWSFNGFCLVLVKVVWLTAHASFVHRGNVLVSLSCFIHMMNRVRNLPNWIQEFVVGLEFECENSNNNSRPNLSFSGLIHYSFICLVDVSVSVCVCVTYGIRSSRCKATKCVFKRIWSSTR